MLAERPPSSSPQSRQDVGRPQRDDPLECRPVSLSVDGTVAYASETEFGGWIFWTAFGGRNACGRSQEADLEALCCYLVCPFP